MMKKMFILLILCCFATPVFAMGQLKIESTTLNGAIKTNKEIKNQPVKKQIVKPVYDTPLGTFEVKTGNVFEDKAPQTQNNAADNQLHIIEQNEVKKVIEQRIYGGSNN